jgi:hypothetical protein
MLGKCLGQDRFTNRRSSEVRNGWLVTGFVFVGALAGPASRTRLKISIMIGASPGLGFVGAVGGGGGVGRVTGCRASAS